MSDAAARAPLSPESVTLLRVLRSAHRRAADSADADSIAPREVDWGVFVELARRNQVAIAVYRNRGDRNLRRMPESASRALRETYLGMVQHGLGLATLWREIVPAIGASGLRVLACRGRALSAELYGDPGFRHSWDINLLLDFEESAKRALNTLHSHGFERIVPGDGRTLHKTVRQDYEFRLEHGRSGAIVGLHWRLLPEPFGRAGESDFMWDGASEQVVEGARCWKPTPAALLRMLLVHGGLKRQWSELRLVSDVAQWLDRHPEQDVSRILKSIKPSRVRAKAAAGLVLAVRLLGCRRDDGELARDLYRSKPVAIAALAMGRIFGLPARLPAYAAWKDYVRWLVPHDLAARTSRATYALAMLEPEFDDVVQHPALPNALHGVRLPLRGLRLLTAAGGDWIQRPR